MSARMYVGGPPTWRPQTLRPAAAFKNSVRCRLLALCMGSTDHVSHLSPRRQRQSPGMCDVGRATDGTEPALPHYGILGF
jgi:hypothetical protein